MLTMQQSLLDWKSGNKAKMGTRRRLLLLVGTVMALSLGGTRTMYNAKVEALSLMEVATTYYA